MPQTTAAAPPIFCIYCGEPISEAGAVYASAAGMYKCENCCLAFTQLDLESFAKRQAELEDSPHSAYSGEDDSLSAAWRLMQEQQWDQALDRLYEHAYSPKHTLEFAFYRGAAQLAPLLTCGKKQLNSRYHILDCLIANLANINSYLPSKNKNDTRRRDTLTKIGEALLLIGRQPIEYHTSICSDDYILDSTCRKRALLLSRYAEYLENCAEGEFSLEYLKMAYQLWCAAWEQAKERKDAVYLTRRDKTMRISIKTRRQIEGKVKELERILTDRLPGFAAQQLSPWPPIIPEWPIALVLLLLAAAIIYMELYC